MIRDNNKLNSYFHKYRIVRTPNKRKSKIKINKH